MFNLYQWCSPLHCTIFLAIFCWDIPWNLGLIYGRYLQFRFLEWPLIWGCFLIGFTIVYTPEVSTNGDAKNIKSATETHILHTPTSFLDEASLKFLNSGLGLAIDLTVAWQVPTYSVSRSYESTNSPLVVWDTNFIQPRERTPENPVRPGTIPPTSCWREILNVKRDLPTASGFSASGICSRTL